MDRRPEKAPTSEDLYRETVQLLDRIHEILEQEASDLDLGWIADTDPGSSFFRAPSSPRLLNLLTRAVSCRLRIVDMALTARRLRDLESSSDSWRQYVERIADDKPAPELVREALQNLLFEPVLTPDPIEASNLDLWQAQYELLRAWVDGVEDGPQPLLQATEALLAADASAPKRSAVRSERTQVLFFLSRSIFPATARLESWRQEAAARLSADDGSGTTLDAAPLLRCMSQVGGDMDGNPQVTADTLHSTFKTHREHILDLYREGLDSLTPLLPPAARQRCEEIRHRLERSELVSEPPDDAYRAADELLRDLAPLADGGEPEARDALRRFIWQVRTFGLHLAAVEQRQDSARHREAVGHLLLDDRWIERPVAGRTRRLRQMMPRVVERPTPPGSPPTVHQTQAVFRALRQARRQGVGDAAIGPFVVSMTEGADDVLAVLWLARRSGFVDDATGQVPLDIVPLFETYADLEAAPDVMRELCSMPLYRAHLDARGGRQWIMFGYGDANRDAGLVAGRWAMRHCRQALAEVQAELPELDILICHGQVTGGDGRRSIRSSSVAGSSPHLRMAISGERLLLDFGLPSATAETVAGALGSTLRHCAGPPRRDRAAAFSAVAESLVTASHRSYRDLVYGEKKLYRYFRLATPIDAIERLVITSRPARRRSQIGVSGLRARPWVLAWTQSRHALPGWFGLGSGLEAAVRDHGVDAVREAVRCWPFLSHLVSDARRALAGASMAVARRYADLSAELGEQVFPLIQQEHSRTLDWLQEMAEPEPKPVEAEPELATLRAQGVEKLSELQIELLTRWRQGGRNDPELLNALLRTVHGLAKGLNNIA